jgi:endosialidase-like protein
MNRMRADRNRWFARPPPVRSVRAAHPFLSFKSLAAAALTFTVVDSGQNAHAQKVVGNPASLPIAGFELPEGARRDARNPERAFNPETGQDLILDGRSQKWIDSKTGQVVGPARTVFFGPPKGARWNKSNPERAFNLQNGRSFVWDAGIAKWIDVKTDRAFNPAYIDQEGKPVLNFALSPASTGRAPPAFDPAVHIGAEVETGGNGSFAENFGYYFSGITKAVSSEIQFYSGRDAFRYLLRRELAGTSKFPEMDDWIKSLVAPIDARLATTAQSGSPWQVIPALSANLSIANVYQSWWTGPDGKLVSGFLAGTTVGVKLVPDFPIADKTHWSGYTATGNLTFSFSDIRLKRDIIELARLDDGIGFYRYRYNWSDQYYVGVLAQEVAAIIPDAVVRGADGYLLVNYGRLGLHLMTWNEWLALEGTKVPQNWRSRRRQYNMFGRCLTLWPH